MGSYLSPFINFASLTFIYFYIHHEQEDVYVHFPYNLYFIFGWMDTKHISIKYKEQKAAAARSLARARCAHAKKTFAIFHDECEFEIRIRAKAQTHVRTDGRLRQNTRYYIQFHFWLPALHLLYTVRTRRSR